LIPDFANLIRQFGWIYGLFISGLAVLLNVNIPYNIVLYLTENKKFADVSVLRLQVLIFFSIVISTILVNSILNVTLNSSLRNLKYSVIWSFYISGFGTLIYLFLRQLDVERKRKLFEKELELVKLNELKTKAELEALHAKINPHFLYNALNSIADLSLVDGSKAREMSLSLADLFRYSINYNNSNYATVKEELEIAKLYLGIEKIRFEDRLEYTIEAKDDILDHRLPRFILQPIVENAVKHGLKNLEQANIIIEVKNQHKQFSIRVYDNGPPFPTELNAGYGLKSIFDKLDLLFTNQYEVKMQNGREKYFEILIYNSER
jgi:sensor histidine kinase YesM